VTLREIRARLRRLGNKRTARLLQGYFKTGPGEYGEGDVFLGIKVPTLREQIRECRDLSLTVVTQLLRSPIHEERLLALLILVNRYSKGTPEDRQAIYKLYLGNTRHINNWDLVDLSAPNIVGAHLADKARTTLHRLAKSQLLWERRIAILATFYFIRQSDFINSLELAEMLLADPEDLIHKATGWMLREIGKRDQDVEEAFLKRHYKRMPRTMLRYAIERFPEKKRQAYLNKTRI
jgi:3-methyladenine DNA glycosylase AlkD